MAEEKIVQFKCGGYIVHAGQTKTEGDVIALNESAAERLSKLGKGEVIQTPSQDGEGEAYNGGEANGGADDGIKLEELSHAELDSFAKENDVDDYPKSGNKDEKVEAIELHLEALSEDTE